MSAYPKLLVSSVVRGSRQGDSHGGLYLVDMNTGQFEQTLDWNASDIEWEGRGADRGLRGIGVVGEEIFIAASDELFVFDRAFSRKASYRNRYLRHCHEISLADGKLWLTSTGFDSLLRFDLVDRAFDFGLQLWRSGGQVNARTFDPQGLEGPPPANEFHINSVHVDATGIYACGRRMPGLVQMTQAGIAIIASLPLGTHNARPYNGGVLFNDTESDTVRWVGRENEIAVPVPRYLEGKLTHTDFDETGLARQAFARGLCPVSSTLIAAGSSPTTVAIHDLAKRTTTALNITMDVRNAAHGLAIWPF